MAFFPRRCLTERRKGKLLTVEAPLFAGYIFIESDGTLSPELYHRLKVLPGFFHLLGPQGTLSELQGSDLELVRRFLGFGQVLQTSQVYFDENQRIRVVSGPMVGMEGQVISVDRRKGRAKIQLDFDHRPFTISLAFEVMTPLLSADVAS
jgi:transcriptional antiterminator NusG